MTDTTEPDGGKGSDAGQLGELVRLARALAAQAEELGEGTGKQLVTLSRRARADRRLIWITFGSLIADVVLTVLLGVGGWQIRENSERVDELTRRLDIAQTTTRQKVLCPLYQALTDSLTPAGRAAAPDKAQYDENAQIIRDGYDALACKEFLTKTP